MNKVIVPLFKRRKLYQRLIISRLLLTRLMVALLNVACLKRCKTNSLIVSDAEQVQKTIAEVVKEFGRIDVFVANAGES